MMSRQFAALASRLSALTLLWVTVLAPVVSIATESAPTTRPPLTLAVADLLYAAPVLIAEAQGYFAAEGLALKVMHCAVGRICLQHVLEGQAQFATVADTPFVLATFSRNDLAIIATTTVSGSELRMVARQDRGVGRAADLRGRRIGIVQGTSGHYYADTFLLFAGLKSADVTLVPLGPSAIVGALSRGEIDAAGLHDPLGRDAARQLGPLGRVLPGPRFFTLTFNLVSAGPRAGVLTEDETRLLRAVRRAEALIRQEPERARAILAVALKMDPAKVAEVWGDFEFRLQLGQPLIHGLEAQARWALREGLVPAGARMPNFLELIQTEPLRRIDPQAMRLIR